MAPYIGTKIVEAVLAKESDVNVIPAGTEDREGYKVTYPGGYESWCPKDVFEANNRKVTLDEAAIIGEAVMGKKTEPVESQDVNVPETEVPPPEHPTPAAAAQQMEKGSLDTSPETEEVPPEPPAENVIDR